MHFTSDLEDKEDPDLEDLQKKKKNLQAQEPVLLWVLLKSSQYWDRMRCHQQFS